jgi:hypothetical protein
MSDYVYLHPDRWPAGIDPVRADAEYRASCLALAREVLPTGVDVYGLIAAADYIADGRPAQEPERCACRPEGYGTAGPIDANAAAS